MTHDACTTNTRLRQTDDLSHACACKSMLKSREHVTCEVCCSPHPVGCSSLQAAVNDLTATNNKKSCKVSLLNVFGRNGTSDLTVLYAASFMSSDAV